MKFALALSLVLAPVAAQLNSALFAPAERCYAMPFDQGRRNLAEGVNFFSNPQCIDGNQFTNVVPGPDGQAFPIYEADGSPMPCKFYCDENAELQGMEAAAFSDVWVNEDICTDLPVTTSDPLVQCESNTPKDKFTCTVTTDPTDCGIDMHWHCKAVVDGFGATLPGEQRAKAIYCGTIVPCKNGGCFGDPHFMTWADETSYDFHGQCDLKHTSDPDFYQGVGLDIDIRTKGRYEYSFIESAAVRLGDDVLELSSYGSVVYNGVENANIDGVKMAGLFEITKMDYNGVANKFGYKITIENDEHIEIGGYKDLVSVKVKNAREHLWGNTVGMLGDFRTGELKSRDGSKTYDINSQEEIDAFGQEWQVRPEEKNLFQTQAAEGKCVMPSKNASVARRLGENAVSEEDAKLACANNKHFQMCVYDVMATGDLALASAGAY